MKEEKGEHSQIAGIQVNFLGKNRTIALHLNDKARTASFLLHQLMFINGMNGFSSENENGSLCACTEH